MDAPAERKPGEGTRAGLAPGAIEQDIARQVDHYFRRTKAAVRRFGDCRATYALFMRRPVIFTPKLALDWLAKVAAARQTAYDIKLNYKEGDWVGAGEPLMYLSGSFEHLVDLETQVLQKLGPACVAAYNAYSMCMDMPYARFLAMDARHCAGAEMAEMMAYAASVGSAAARRDGALGFVGNANDATAHFFGNQGGLGTMPHALIGYAGFYRACGGNVRRDLSRRCHDRAGRLLRPGDHRRAGSLPALSGDGGGRQAVVPPGHPWRSLRRGPGAAGILCRAGAPRAQGVAPIPHRGGIALAVGTGVSAASIFHLRDQLDRNGFQAVKIVASSGFNPAKCQVIGSVKAPVDVVGTGSYLPDNWRETYATADVIAYDGRVSVKIGREFLLQKWQNGGVER